MNYRKGRKENLGGEVFEAIDEGDVMMNGSGAKHHSLGGVLCARRDLLLED